ncbi:Putative peptide zinc metalloprotease protein YydH [Lignipirellula cremea]|uniref:Peptide zinc metalloprotease protein YydH n=2 Tax=Lignipirellula cremea TaxID=2528010 RepID=A0A518DUM8_9BACT|nr:Putative peptide zinc metalloprotease protein YydH [Lignipirellula cremea]
MRHDLEVREARYQGRRYWLIKDPLALNYFRFEEEEYALLQMLDGKTSADEISERFHQKFSPETISTPELHQFLGMLYRSSLIVSHAPDQGVQLQRRKAENARKERNNRLSNVLAIRFQGFDPDRLLARMSELFGWIFSTRAFCFFALIGLSALCLAAVEFETFARKLPTFQQFFAYENWIYLAATLAVTKVLHELGHGLACKRFGGECHEMGLMLLIFTPCLYCNVSDSWMLPSKWRRAAIGAAGMYVEFILASIALWLWWFSKEGMFNYLCLNVVFVCSVSTLLFNANPLLRYDGYYILADLLEIPNLRQKASTILSRTASSWMLGLDSPEDPFLPRKKLWAFAAYAIASGVYRWVVAISIMWVVYRVFEPYGLKAIGGLIALMSIYALVVAPLWGMLKFLLAPGRMRQVNKLRAAVSLAVIAAAIAGVLIIPLPHYVRCSFTIAPRDAAYVYIDAAGEIQDVYAKSGKQVAQGEVLLTLHDVDVQLAVEQIEGQLRELAARRDSLARSAFHDPRAADEIAAVEKEISSLEEQLTRHRRNQERLVIRAPQSGVIIPPPPRKNTSREEGLLPQWSGQPLDTNNVGATLTESTLVCRIGDPTRLEAVLAIDQSEMEFVGLDQKAEIFVSHLPHRVYGTHIARIANEKMKLAPRNLSVRGGGPLAVTTAPGGYETPASPTYEAAVPLEDPRGELFVGATGRARIHVGQRTIGEGLWRYLCQTFAFEM